MPAGHAIEQSERYHGTGRPQCLRVGDEALDRALPGEPSYILTAALLDRRARGAICQPSAHALEEGFVITDRDALVADGFPQGKVVAGEECCATGLGLDGGDAEHLGEVGRIDDELALG